MLTLALDTTTRAGSVAVLDNDHLLALVHGDASRTHGERLPTEIEQALVSATVTREQLGLLCVASGPGAFTGLRIGLAAIQGMAMVLGVPVVGVSALDALAWEAWAARHADEHLALAWMDAQRGEVFATHYDRLDMVRPSFDDAGEPATVGSPADVLNAMLASIATPTSKVIAVGDGALRYGADLERRLAGRCRIIETPALAPAIARIGQRLAARGHAGPPHALQPLYVRRPDAELERARRLV